MNREMLKRDVEGAIGNRLEKNIKRAYKHECI